MPLSFICSAADNKTGHARPYVHLPIIWSGHPPILSVAEHMEGASARGEASASERLHAEDAHRAGRYVFQPQGYRAFIPSPLPPQPPVRLEGELQAMLS